jgi:hypothetical protein
MKTRTTSSMLIALLLASLTLGVTKAQAFIDIYRPVGITFGQTARVTAANTGTTAIIVVGGKFLDSDGNVLAEFARQVIEPGKMMSFDLNADDIIRENNRIQIRVVIEGSVPHLRSLLFSLEVFNNADGKTTVFLGGPDT